MTDAEKLAQVKSLMNITGTDLDAQLAVFLSFAKNEILAWLYNGKTPEGITDVPERYETVQIMAVVYATDRPEPRVKRHMPKTALAERGNTTAWLRLYVIMCFRT